MDRIIRSNFVQKVFSQGTIFTGIKYKIVYSKKYKGFDFIASVSRKIGNAVIRNKEKRWIRDILQHYNDKQGFFIIIVKQTGGSYINAKKEIDGFFCSAVISK